jgi:hypothetical protein
MHGNDAQKFLSDLNARVSADYAKTENWNDKAQKTYDDAVVKQFTAVANRSISATSNVAAKVMITNNDNLLLVVGHPTAIEKYRKDFISHMSEEAVISVTLIPIRETPGIIVGFKDETLDKKVMHSDLSTVSMNDAEDYISHFGIRGMKWGVRRSDAQLSKTSGDSVDAARAATTLKTIKTTKSLSSVSDADLNHLINRINTEKRYAELDTKTASLAKRNKTIKTILATGVLMNEAVNFVNSPVGRTVGNRLGLFTSTGKHTKGYIDEMKKLAEAKKYVS